MQHGAGLRLRPFSLFRQAAFLEVIDMAKKTGKVMIEIGYCGKKPSYTDHRFGTAEQRRAATLAQNLRLHVHLNGKGGGHRK